MRSCSYAATQRPRLRHACIERQRFRRMQDLQRFAAQRVVHAVGVDGDIDAAALPDHAEAVTAPRRRQHWIELQLRASGCIGEHAKSAESPYERMPATRHRGHVCAVAGVAVQIVEIDAQGAAEIVFGFFDETDFRREHRERRCRQRRVVHGDGFVVIETAPLGRAIELFAGEHEREHRIGLLAHLMTEQRQRMVMDEQRILIVRRAEEIPHRFVEKRIVLRDDAEAFVVRQAHRVGSDRPRVDFRIAQRDFLRQLRVQRTARRARACATSKRRSANESAPCGSCSSCCR